MSRRTVPVRVVALNRADYDGRGARTAKRRTPKIVKKVCSYNPDLVCFQELSAANLAATRRLMSAAGYASVAEGAKGREIFRRKSITKIAATLGNVDTMIDGNRKEFVHLAYEKAGVRGTVTSFHNAPTDNERVKTAQLYEVLEDALDFAGAHRVAKANVGVFGDSNLPIAEDIVERWGWKSAGKRAPRIGGRGWKTMTHWIAKKRGKPIDVALFRKSARVRRWWQSISTTLSDHNLHVTDYELVGPL